MVIVSRRIGRPRGHERGPDSLAEKLDDLRDFAVSRLSCLRERLADPNAIHKARALLAEQIGKFTLERASENGEASFKANGQIDFFGEGNLHVSDFLWANCLPKKVSKRGIGSSLDRAADGGQKVAQNEEKIHFAPEHEQQKRGRRSADDSHATAIRTRLTSWLREPEDQRPSLRALAIQLGTSHQLLSFYLKGLNKWQRKDYERQAEAIPTRANTEHRFMAPSEECRVRALEHAAFCCMIDSILQQIATNDDSFGGACESRNSIERGTQSPSHPCSKGCTDSSKNTQKNHRNNLPSMSTNHR